jgi:transcriptional regulator with XRE-family HTH domain
VETSETAQGNAAFGSYLKKVREGRRLSLDAVEELSAGFPEKVTKSHLSRIENGLALPSFPRLMALSHIYGMPIASLAERYELDLRRGMAPVDLGVKTDADALKQVQELEMSGRYPEALDILQAMLDRGQSNSTPLEIHLRVNIVGCLVHTGRFEFAKTACEELLSMSDLPHVQRLRLIEYFAMCCMRLGRYTVALMALDQVERELDRPETPRRAAADLCAIRGSTYFESGTASLAIPEFERAKKLYMEIPNEYEACRTGLNLCEAYIAEERYDEASRTLQAELVVAERHGFERHRALAFSHLCVVAYRRGELEAAEAHAIRSNTIARVLEHVALVFRNCFYLWRIAGERHDLASARVNERSLRAIVGRLEIQLAEANEFRAYLARGDHDEHR